MKMKPLRWSMLLSAALLIGFTSCDKDEVKEQIAPITKTDSIRVSFDTRNGDYTLFSFKNGTVVPQSDSATAKWDFGIRFVNIIVNSHASGPGNASVITENGIYETYMQAPTTGYAYDTSATQRAINSGIPDGWYDYNHATHAFTPKAGLFFVFRSVDNKYVKMEILSAEYEAFTGPMPEYVIYKFRYTYQADGSVNFK